MIEAMGAFFTGIFGFIGGVMFSFWFLVLLILGSLLNDSKNNSGWAIFFGAVAIFSAFGVFGIGDLSTFSWVILAAIYIIAGSFYSIWRWFRHTRHVTAKFNHEIKVLTQQGDTFDRAVKIYKRDTNYRENMSAIGYWFAMWPISGITNLAGDFILAAEKFVTTFIGGVFDQISERARDSASIDVSKYE